MATRERILQKSQELFQRFGIRSVTMDEIASQLGMSKKTIYQFFADKDELVDAVADAHIQDNRCRCTQGKERAKNAIHEIFLTIDMMQEIMTDMSATVFYDLEKFHPKTFAKFMEHRNKYLYKVFRDNLEWGIKEDLYRPHLNIDVITKLRLEIVFLPFNQIVFPQSKYTLLQVEKEILEHYLYGIATAKAHKLIDKYKQERVNEIQND